MKPLIMIQARCGSSRLPNKVLMPIGQGTVIEQVVRRCKMSQRAGGVVVVTTVEERDVQVVAQADRLGVRVFRGSEQDVLDRYLRACEAFGAAQVVRITADCPLIDPRIIDDCIALWEAEPADYVYIDGYPNGLGAAELLDVEALRRAHRETTPNDTYFREHVMTYLTEHPEKFRLKIGAAPAVLHRPELRLSVDEQADLDVARAVTAHFAPRLDFSAAEIVAFLDAHPDVVAHNRHVKQKTR